MTVVVTSRNRMPARCRISCSGKHKINVQDGVDMIMWYCALRMESQQM